MDKPWLETQVAAGRSIESIAKKVGLNPSTVGYWMNKHGLTSTYAERHRAKGGIDRDVLEELVSLGLTTQEMAEQLGLGASTVRYWLRKHDLRTARATEIGEQSVAQEPVMRRCRRHGLTVFVPSGASRRLRCRLCRSAHVTERRRRVKQLLVDDAGGCCVVCGYSRYAGALQFHHRDPALKSFSLSAEGIARSLEKARTEAQKCDLVCANCHAEVEGGIATIPP